MYINCTVENIVIMYWSSPTSYLLIDVLQILMQFVCNDEFDLIDRFDST